MIIFCVAVIVVGLACVARCVIAERPRDRAAAYPRGSHERSTLRQEA